MLVRQSRSLAPFGSLIASGLATRIVAPNNVILGGIVLLVQFLHQRLPVLNKMVHPIYIKLGMITEDVKTANIAAQITDQPED